MTKHKALVFLCGLALMVIPNIVYGSRDSYLSLLQNPGGLTQAADSVTDSSMAYTYAFYALTVFSYDDSNTVRILNDNGTELWSAMLAENEYKVVDLPQAWFYQVKASKGISVMNSNPFTYVGTGSFFALDQNGQPFSKKFLTVGPYGHTNPPTCERNLVVFAYEDSTYVRLENLSSGSTVWEGYLDSAQYYKGEFGEATPQPLLIEASNPVSAVTGAFSVSMYAPALNGTFTGRDFLTYAHYEAYVQDLQVIPWEDSTWVTVIDLDDPSDTIWRVFCYKKGWIQGIGIAGDSTGRTALYIKSDKDISVSQTPWTSYIEGTPCYTVFGVTREGFAFGTEFYLPLPMTGPGDEFARLQVISYKNNNSVAIKSIPKVGGEETTIWSGVLNNGQYYVFTSGLWDPASHAIYHVIATDTVVTIGSYSWETAGYSSNFCPVLSWKTAEPGGTEELDRPPLCHLQITTSPAREIAIRYHNWPQGFSVQVFDASGRKVDELYAPTQSGILTWGSNQPPGIYFIVPGNGIAQALKVILIR